MPDDQNYSLNDFAETLLREKNYTTLTAEMRVELKADIVERAQDYLLARTIAKLTDDQAKEFNTLLDANPSEEQIQEFIKKSIPDTPTFIGDTMFQFRQTYLGLN